MIATASRSHRLPAVRHLAALGVALAALALLTAGAAAANGAAAGPVVRMVPDHNLRAAHPHSARSAKSAKSATTVTSAPCWASSNWSGYAVSQTTPSGLSCLPASGTAYTSVTAHWTVPAVTVTRSVAYSAAWVGIDGFTNANLIQAGTEQDSTGRAAKYAAWWEILPAAETTIPSITVRPGDAITVSIAKVAASQWTITLTDQGSATHAAQPPFSTTQTYSGAGTSAEWVLEAPEVNGRVATLAQYGPTTFDLSTVDGTTPGLVTGDSGEMVQGSRVVSTPSAPDTGAPAGDGFSIAYGSSAPAAPTS